MISISKIKGAFLILFILFNVNSSFAKKGKSKLEVIIIQDTSIARSEKEAFLILPGLGDGKKQRKHQSRTFNMEYDLFIPDYVDKESFDATFAKFTDFHRDQKLGEYKKLHIFAYILGTWTINTFINKNGIQNIKSIVYDRSPMQERAPIIVVENIPRIGKMMFGQLVTDLSKMPYPTIDTHNVNIGLIVESKATGIMRHFKEETIFKGEYNWGNIDYKQDYDDLMYIHLNHNEMYLDLLDFALNVEIFFEYGQFTTHPQRYWYGWDSFEKLPKMKKSLFDYNEDFIGDWQTEDFYYAPLKDTVINTIYFDKGELSIFEYYKFKSKIAGCGVESGFPKVDKNGTVVRMQPGGNVLPLNQEPTKEADGRISIILNNIKYYKKTGMINPYRIPQ